MKKNIFLVLAALSLMAVNIGCSSQGDITDISVKAKKYTLGQQSGIVSGSQQNATTSNGYNVSSSVGSWSSGIEQATSGGYKVYSSVQGNMASETFNLVTVE